MGDVPTTEADKLDKVSVTKNAINIAAASITCIPITGQLFGAVWYTMDVISILSTGKGLGENISDEIYR